MKTSSLLPALLLSAFAMPAFAAVRPCPTPITLSPATLAGGTTGLAYSQTLTASGGTAYTFSITKGGLPPGFALTNPTATTIDLTGPPTTPGTFVFTLTARNTSNGCSGGRTFSLFVNDRTVVTTTAGTTAFVEDGGAVLVDSGVTATDTDSPNLASATVTITNPQDGAAEVLSATACAGLTVTPGLNSLSITGSQPPAAYQTCLRSVTYNNGSQNPGTTARVLTFVANDGIASSAPANKTVSVAGVNDPPVANPISPPAFNEDTPSTITLSYTDVEGDLATACAVTGLTNVTVSAPCGCIAGVCTVGVTGTANYNGPASFSYTVTANAQTSNSALASLTITAVNDAPVLGGVSGGFTYTENDAATAIAPALTVTDVDSTTMSSATISISGNFQSGQDVLVFVNGPGMGNVSVASNVGGVLTLTSAGSTATTAQWQTALRAATYNNSSDDPNTSVRTVTFQINDGGAVNNLSNQPTRTITVVAVNDPPTANAFANQPAQAGIPIAYPAGKLGGTDLEAGTTITIDLTPINVTNATVSLAANGSFTLTPLPAATTASFQYRVSDNGNPAPGLNSAYATVSFTVAGPAIYFVRSAGAGDCTLGNECTLAQAVTNIGTSINARIFISDANSHAAAVPLNSGGWLIGQGVTGTTFDALFGILVPAQGSLAPRPSLAQPRPTVTNTVTLNANSAVRGLNISSAAAAGITDVAAAITGALVSEVAVTTTTATAINLSNIVGTFSFTGVTTTGGAGVSLTGANAGATFSFSALSISSGASAAFTATGGGTVTATQDNVTIVNTLTATTGAALNVANTTIGASGLTFRSISANGAVNGIVLSSTGAGGLTVTGNSSGLCGGQVGSGPPATPAATTAPNSADCTGGTIQNTTGAGIVLTNASNVSLTRLWLRNAGNDGVQGTNVTGFTLASSLVEGNGNALNENGLDFGDSSSITPDGLHGTAGITNSTIRNSYLNNVVIRNLNGAALTSLTITGSQFRSDPANGDANDSILLETLGTANIATNISGNHFSSIEGDHFQSAASNSGTFDITFSNNTLTGGHSTPLGQGITINAATGVAFGGYTGRIDYDVNGNNINGAVSNGVAVVLGTSGVSAVFSGFVRNNVVGTSGSALSCSTQANGVYIDARGNGTHTSAVTGNVIRQCFDRGILSEAGDGDSVLNLTVTGNTIDQQVGALTREAIQTNHGITSTNVFGNVDTNVVCLQLGGAGALANTFSHGAGAPDDFRLRKRFEATVRLPGYAGGTGQDPGSLGQVVTFIQGQNIGSAGEPGSASASGAGGGFTGGAACPTP